MTLTDSRTPSADPGTTRGVAQEMAAVVTPLFGGTLPLRIRAWDGSEAGPAQESGAPTVVVNDSAALRRLVYRPGELGLAQAYVTGEIDVEGDLLDGFRRVWRASREQGASPRLNPVAVTSGVRTTRVGASAGPAVEPSQARMRTGSVPPKARLPIAARRAAAPSSGACTCGPVPVGAVAVIVITLRSVSGARSSGGRSDRMGAALGSP